MSPLIHYQVRIDHSVGEYELQTRYRGCASCHCDPPAIEDPDVELRVRQGVPVGHLRKALVVIEELIRRHHAEFSACQERLGVFNDEIPPGGRD